MRARASEPNFTSLAAMSIHSLFKGSRGGGRVMLQTPGDEDDDENDQNEPETTTREQPPTAAMTPRREHGYQCDHREKYQDRSERRQCIRLVGRAVPIVDLERIPGSVRNGPRAPLMRALEWLHMRLCSGR